MVELTLRVPEAMAHPIEELVKYMPEVEIERTVEIQDANSIYDLAFKSAISELQYYKVFKQPRDYAWIMLGIEQDLENDLLSFSSTRSFVAYLHILGLGGVPSNTCLYNATQLVTGVYPDWVFLDDIDVSEERRRKEVFQLFLVAFRNARKRISEHINEQTTA
jgi:hypothetical protein